MSPLSFAELEKLAQSIESKRQTNKWILCAPDGRAWEGDPMELLQVLVPYHPLMKAPYSFEEAKQP